jgi:hypothetical protein
VVAFHGAEGMPGVALIDAHGTPQVVSVSVALPAGTATIRATATTAPGGPNTDYLEVS